MAKEQRQYTAADLYGVDAVYGAEHAWVRSLGYAGESVSGLQDGFVLRRAGGNRWLVREEKMTAKDVSRAIKLYKIDAEEGNPVEV